jgi:hypothetical protein
VRLEPLVLLVYVTKFEPLVCCTSKPEGACFWKILGVGVLQ